MPCRRNDGLDRYYQVVKCFRDEDLRADRQPEKLGAELRCQMSLIDEDDIMGHCENFIRETFEQVMKIKLPAKFTRMPYDQAMEEYGNDKPDLRFRTEIKDRHRSV